MSRDSDRVRKDPTKNKKKNARPPVRIVHLDNDGKALCGLPSPYPSDCHGLAEAFRSYDQIDVCLTCKEVAKWKSDSTAKS